MTLALRRSIICRLIRDISHPCSYDENEDINSLFHNISWKAGIEVQRLAGMNLKDDSCSQTSLSRFGCVRCACTDSSHAAWQVEQVMVVNIYEGEMTAAETLTIQTCRLVIRASEPGNQRRRRRRWLKLKSVRFFPIMHKRPIYLWVFGFGVF